MAEIKDKVVTVESLKTLHDYNKENYMTKIDPTGTGDLSITGIETETGSITGTLSINRKAGTTIGNYSVSEGYNGTASGAASHVEGYESVASGINSHAENYKTTAKGNYSHTEGFSTVAAGDSQHVQGKYNIEDKDNSYAHIIGNGDSTTPSNAHTVTWEGDAWYAGSFSADGNIILTSNQYGDKFPTDPIDEGGKGEPHIAGRIFFKRLVE